MFESIIQVLREELVLYGEALSLLERQRELLAPEVSDELADNVEALSELFERIAAVRARREHIRKAAAQAQQLAPRATIRELIGGAPPDYHPLLQALVDEINDLVARSRTRLLGNNFLLRRAIARELQKLSPIRPRAAGSCRARREPSCRTSLAHVMAAQHSLATAWLSRKRIAARSEALDSR